MLLAVAAAGAIHPNEYRDCDGDGEEDECAGDAEGNNVSFGDMMVGEVGHGRRVVERVVDGGSDRQWGIGLGGCLCDAVSQLLGACHIQEHVPTGWTELGVLTHWLATADNVTRVAVLLAVVIVSWMIGTPAAIRVPTGPYDFP